MVQYISQVLCQVSCVLLDVFHQFFKDMTVHLLQIAYLHLPIHYFLFLLLRTNNITSIVQNILVQNILPATVLLQDFGTHKHNYRDT